MMVMAPFLVESTTASMTALVPFENFSNSKTPSGLKNWWQYRKTIIKQISQY